MTPDEDCLTSMSSMELFPEESAWLSVQDDGNTYINFSIASIGTDSVSASPLTNVDLGWAHQNVITSGLIDVDRCMWQSQEMESPTSENPIQDTVNAEFDFLDGLLEPQVNSACSVNIDDILQALSSIDDGLTEHTAEAQMSLSLGQNLDQNTTENRCAQTLYEAESSPNNGRLRRSRRGHSSGATYEQYKCYYENCGRVYPKSSHLKMHLRRHTGEKPFQCPWPGCTWRFSRSDELNRHHRSHTGDKPYHCVICNKKFGRSDHLAKHRRVHERFAAQSGYGMLPSSDQICGNYSLQHPEPPKRGRPRKGSVRSVASRMMRSEQHLQPIMPRPCTIAA